MEKQSHWKEGSERSQKFGELCAYRCGDDDQNDFDLVADDDHKKFTRRRRLESEGICIFVTILLLQRKNKNVLKSFIHRVPELEHPILLGVEDRAMKASGSDVWNLVLSMGLNETQVKLHIEASD
jgi:hypothetical protein